MDRIWEHRYPFSRTSSSPGEFPEDRYPKAFGIERPQKLLSGSGNLKGEFFALCGVMNGKRKELFIASASSAPGAFLREINPGVVGKCRSAARASASVRAA